MTDIRIQVTDPTLPEARRLVAELDAFLQGIYSPECNHLVPVEELAQPNVVFLTAHGDGKTVGCGAYLDCGSYAELKRMYVQPEYRSLRIGSRLLKELEKYAVAAGLKIIRLETGVYQPEAIRLYARAGYQRRGAFGSYSDDEKLSVFMEKKLE